MSWEHVVAVVLTTIIGIIAFNFSQAIAVLHEVNKSVGELNVRVAVVIEKMATHEKRLDVHDEEIRNIKSNKED